MSPAELAEHRTDMAALVAEASHVKAAAEASAQRIVAMFCRAAAVEPDPIRSCALGRGAIEICAAIKTTFPADPVPRVRNVRPLAAWQSRRETEAAGRNSDALAVSPRRAGAP